MVIPTGMVCNKNAEKKSKISGWNESPVAFEYGKKHASLVLIDLIKICPLIINDIIQSIWQILIPQV